MKAMNAGLLAFALTLGAAVSPQTAVAAGSLWYTGNAGADCQPSSGRSGETFYFAPQYVQNTVTTGNYIVCSFPLLSDPSLPYTADGTTGLQVAIGIRNTAATNAQTTCVAQLGYDGQSASLTSISSKSGTLAANTGGELLYGTTDLPIRSNDASLSVNCLVPGGGVVSYIDVVQPKNF
ncbi:hypothetical protein [Lysobacter humi (ex Lee et al. 2017)]